MATSMFEFFGRTSATTEVCRWMVPFAHILAVQVHIDSAEDAVYLINGTVIYIDSVGLDDSFKDHVDVNQSFLEAYSEYQDLP